MTGNVKVCYKNCTMYAQSYYHKGPAVRVMTLGPAVSNLDLAKNQNILNSPTALYSVEVLLLA